MVGKKYVYKENFIGMNSFGGSGPYKNVYEHFNITADFVLKKIRKKLNSY
jgi:Transketolase